MLKLTSFLENSTFLKTFEKLVQEQCRLQFYTDAKNNEK